MKILVYVFVIFVSFNLISCDNELNDLVVDNTSIRLYINNSDPYTVNIISGNGGYSHIVDIDGIIDVKLTGGKIIITPIIKGKCNITLIDKRNKKTNIKVVIGEVLLLNRWYATRYELNIISNNECFNEIRTDMLKDKILFKCSDTDSKLWFNSSYNIVNTLPEGNEEHIHGDFNYLDNYLCFMHKYYSHKLKFEIIKQEPKKIEAYLIEDLTDYYNVKYNNKVIEVLVKYYIMFDRS